MKKLIYLALVVIAVGVLFAARNQNISGNPIKIGATLPLTGAYSFIGEAARNGLQIAVEDVNQDGGIDGRQLVLVVEDNQGQANLAVSGTQKMINSDGVDLVFTSFTHIAQAIQNVLASADVPMIYASTLASIAKDNELFFRDYFDTDSLGTGIAQKVAKEGHKRIGYIGEKSDSCAAYLLKVKEVFDGQGISIVSEQRFAADENDLKTYLLKIKDTRPDAIVTCSNRKSDIFMRQMNQIGMIGVQSFQTHAPFLPNGDTQEIRSLYEKNKSVSTWYGFAQGSLNEKQVAFKKRYEEKFKIKLVPDAAFAYDDVMVSATAMKECFSDGGLNNRCFLENLAKTNSDGVSGRLKFNEFRSSERETILIQVVNGEWVQVR